MISDDITKAEFLGIRTRNIANTMYRPDPDYYLVNMHFTQLGLEASDLNAGSRAFRGLNKVKKAFSFKSTPTTSRLTRAVSSIMSPLSTSTANTLKRNYSRATMNSTPKGPEFGESIPVVEESPMEVGDESPKSSRITRAMMPPPKPSPARPMEVDGAASTPSRQGGFALPRTPSCMRRASFKFAKSLSKML